MFFTLAGIKTTFLEFSLTIKRVLEFRWSKKSSPQAPRLSQVQKIGGTAMSIGPIAEIALSPLKSATGYKSLVDNVYN